MTLTVAMTGATGFAGRPAVDQLLGRGFKIRALVRTATAASLPGGVEIVEGDLDNAEALDALMQGADSLVHVAGAIAAINRAGFFAVNQVGTQNAVAAARRAGVRRIVHVSSLAAREPQLSPYGASKAAGEDVVRSSGLDHVILRPPAVYGPGDKATLPLIKEMTRPVAMIPSTAEARFSLLHVGDLSRVLADAADSRLAGLFEISDGKEGGYSWTELCAAAAAHEGRSVRPVFLPRGLVDKVATVADWLARVRGKPAMVSRSKVAELYHPDWVARGNNWPMARPTPFPEGLAETLGWYRQRGWLPPARRAVRSRAQDSTETHT